MCQPRFGLTWTWTWRDRQLHPSAPLQSAFHEFKYRCRVRRWSMCRKGRSDVLCQCFPRYLEPLRTTWRTSLSRSTPRNIRWSSEVNTNFTFYFKFDGLSCNIQLHNHGFRRQCITASKETLEKQILNFWKGRRVLGIQWWIQACATDARLLSFQFLSFLCCCWQNICQNSMMMLLSEVGYLNPGSSTGNPRSMKSLPVPLKVIFLLPILRIRERRHVLSRGSHEC